MHVVEGKTFVREIDDGGLVLRDLSLEDCFFDNCAFSYSKEPSSRSRLLNSRLIRCRSFNSDLGPAVLSDVLIEDLLANQLIICWSPVFRRVKLRGRITSLKINAVFSPTSSRTPAQRAFEADARAFYAETDWALDITEAWPSTLEISGVPTELIRYDPGRALVVTREQVLSDEWRSRVAPWNSHWSFSLDLFLEDGEPSKILVAPYGKKRLREGLQNLRDAGLGV